MTTSEPRASASSPGAGTPYVGVASWLTAHDAAAAAALTAAEGGDGPAGQDVAAAMRPAPRLPAARPVPAAQALPAGRLGYRTEADPLVCHTLIDPGAYAQLRATGRVGPDVTPVSGSQLSSPELAAAYDWMRWQMHRRIDGYSGRYPMWLWARIRRSSLAAMVRHHAREHPGGVLLTLRVPADRVVLSNFVAWHSVLNGGAEVPLDCPVCGLARCDEQACLEALFDEWSDAWDARTPRAPDGTRLPWWTWPKALQTELFDTWETVLQPHPRYAVQACVEFIEADWVLDAVTPVIG